MATTGMGGWICFLFGLLVLTSPFANCDDAGNYIIGVGIADITGPSAELGMMGYASLSQSVLGIHTRLFARAFIVGDPQDTEGKQRVVFVSSDLGMIDQAIKTQVVKVLYEKGYGDRYTSKNVLLSGTHTHSGPAGYIQYVLYGITSLGFNKQNFQAIVTGIVESIIEADRNLVPGKILINKGKVENANINRSPSAYDNNPTEEKDQYPDGNTDKDMTLLKFVSAAGQELGTVNWFAVHPTSMNNTNRLISGDNKGYAEILFEYEKNPGKRPGQGSFVAAFASSNLGDVSPNTNGAMCISGPQAGQPCDYETSTCLGKANKTWNEMCIAFGPGRDGDMLESTEIIGRLQFEKALELYEGAMEELKGNVQFKHQFVNMTNYEFELNGVTKHTCPGALGYSFAAGTTDGPGAFDFFQGSKEISPIWEIVKGFLKTPAPKQIECQQPKPILLDIGEMPLPFEWAPSIVETQVLKIGNLFISGIPGELTTMAGRRMRKAIKGVAEANGLTDTHEVVAGLSNVYTHYITTPEEYDVQRYEGASTIYGRNTLDAYLFQYKMLTDTMLKNEAIEEGPTPPNYLKSQISLVSPILLDTAPLMSDFGDVLIDPPNLVYQGQIVKTTFSSGHPRNNAMREGSFLLVERQNGDKWDTVATDADWSTKFEWGRFKPISSESHVNITWATSATEQPGFYRIQHFGYYKPALQTPKVYSGSTRIFQVAAHNAPLLSHPDWSPNPPPKRKITSITKFWNALFRQGRQKSLLTGELSLQDAVPQELKNFM